MGRYARMEVRWTLASGAKLLRDIDNVCLRGTAERGAKSPLERKDSVYRED